MLGIYFGYGYRHSLLSRMRQMKRGEGAVTAVPGKEEAVGKGVSPCLIIIDWR
ncbi:hypothetical protein [uncultured Megasphaera sp.]|jgi:hypothetical protein|uniref:hypothetical protein n=1 Tax=uncultured Megasphaera sp. TaxID=165188 RepID=UPI0026342A4F|nr:hypothetical protein [uncultured Megasphaera sp.]